MNLYLAVDLLAPNAGLAFWIAVVFLLLMLLLWKFAWGPMTSALSEREQTIAASIRRAEAALAEARQLQADNEKARREAEAEAQRILREAREAADAARNASLDKERQQIEHLRAQFQEEMVREKEQIKGELRSEVADLAIQAAEKILRENLDANSQRRLVVDFINDLPTS
jgi:F-type H+-transporting ATPase subunit b